jgi:hypothetical protein
MPSDTEQRLAKFTELVASAIANSEAHEELARLADEQAALRRVAMLAAKGAPPVAVFEAVSKEVAELFRADAGAVMRYEAGGTLTAAGAWTASQGHAPTGMRFTLEGSVSGLILKSGRPLESTTSRLCRVRPPLLCAPWGGERRQERRSRSKGASGALSSCTR